MELDQDVARELMRLERLTKKTASELLRDLLEMAPRDTPRSDAAPVALNKKTVFRTRDGFELRVGLKLWKRFNEKEWHAEVMEDGIAVAGLKTPFSSLSAAANAITKGSNNGWSWWKYQDGGKWRPLDRLR